MIVGHDVASARYQEEKTWQDHAAAAANAQANAIDDVLLAVESIYSFLSVSQKREAESFCSMLRTERNDLLELAKKLVEA